MTTHLSALTPASSEGRSFRLLTIAAFLAVAFAPIVQAQAPAAATAVAAAPSPAELEKLVDRIALYPDDLVTIILPAATNPLQLVEADRFLDKRKKDPKLPVKDSWDDAVKSLLNYPDVVKMMSTDLDWTTALGEAVVANQGAVFDAVQAFRRKTQAAGNLKSDTKQVVVVEKEIIKIVPADPQVIYVPQYNPSTVVVYGGYSSWGYYPTPYPVYYYPYPPGAAFATGLIWGAAIGAAWSGNRYGWGSNNDININNSTNISGGGNTVNRPGTGSGAGNRPSQRPAGGGSSQWKPNKQPGQVSGSIGKPSGGRVGDAGVGGVGGGSRPSTQPAGGGRDVGGGSRPSTQPAGGGRDYGGGAFGGSSASGRQTQMDSSRGAASRNSMSGASSRQAPSGARAGGGGGSGARAGGGGGGRGGGGGGGRGGGGRR
jgi:hypothetical protein